MAEVTFKCPLCGAECKADLTKCGSAMTCPGCGQTVEIPGGVPAAARAVVCVTGVSAFLIGFWDKAMDWAACRKADKLLDWFDKFLVPGGIYALILAGPIGLVLSIVLAVRSESGMPLIWGAVWLVACAGFLYVNDRMFQIFGQIIDNTPTVMTSNKLLRCFAVLLFLSGIGVLVSGTSDAVETECVQPFFSGLGTFVGCILFLIFALFPARLNVSPDQTCSPGEELIGIFSFFIKGALKVVPYIWSLTVIAWVVCAFVSIFSKEFFNENGIFIMGASMFLLVMPMAVYLSFLFYFILVDVLRAILALPAKLGK